MYDAVFAQAVATVLDGLNDAADLAAGFPDSLQAVLLDPVLGLGNSTGEVLRLVDQVKAGNGWDEPGRLALSINMINVQ
jgi:hypothetical protein